jgi:sarcosine oxidase
LDQSYIGGRFLAENTNHFDCIVVGFGGIGSAALRSAALHGWKVLGLDRFGPAHDKGSSHGRTRIIRRAYFEHPNYVPLANRAFEMWDELNKRHRTSISVKELMTQTGVLQVGNPESELIQGVAKSAEEHGLRVEKFDVKQIQQRLPIFKIPSNQIGLYEADAAILRVEQCVAAAINQAKIHGAEVRSNTVVTGWQAEDSGTIKVVTEEGTFQTDRLVIASGSWGNDLLGSLGLKLQILQKQQYWFQLDRVDQKLLNQFPCFLIEQSNGDCFYGVPEIDYLGMKVCQHTGGVPLSHPSKINRDLNQDVFNRVDQFMKQHMHFGRSRLVHHSTCMYTMSPDGHFIVDRHPENSQVVFAAGMSGHGFKFAPVLGKHLVDLLNGVAEPEFDFLKLAGRSCSL